MAYQIHDAYGRDRVQDRDSNEEHRKESRVYQNAVIAAGAASAPSLGLTGLQYQNLALSLVTIAIDMSIDRSYDNTWATGLMVKQSGESLDEAVARLHMTMTEAFEKGMDQQGIAYEVFQHMDFDEDSIYNSRELTVYAIDAPEYGCVMTDGDSTCAAIVRGGFIREANEGPLKRASGSAETWKLPFNVNTGTTVKFIFGDDVQSTLPTIDIYESISKAAPDWLYFFIPDSAGYPLVDKGGRVKGYPYFLNQGEELHFVTPKSEQSS
ncbi:hypothetical protein soil367_18650 (plasmid) [Hydrocarboniclastica marina]|uniref:Uncharacterized protein n=2 Tax=Hydrocarboniclastica marina TaxID=2259620 RepID=A0A4P7XMT8_9ALTE|nr:hypothetical protein soil367_18650 [Hydrocarboniclastica marina]